MSDEADSDVVLLRLDRGERGEVRLSRSRYQGYVFTRLQLYYPVADGELRPGRQCITIRDHELADVVEALARIARKIGPQERPQRRGSRRREPQQRQPRPALPPSPPPATDEEIAALDEIF